MILNNLPFHIYVTLFLVLNLVSGTAEQSELQSTSLRPLAWVVFGSFLEANKGIKRSLSVLIFSEDSNF